MHVFKKNDQVKDTQLRIQFGGNLFSCILAQSKKYQSQSVFSHSLTPL